MFVRYFTELPYPLAQVEDALLRSPAEWIPGVAEHAEDFGQHLLADVGFGQGTRMARQVVIDLKDPVRFPSRTVLPISWHAADHENLYPKLEADIEVAALGPDLTQFSVSARYQPPLGPVGKAIDKTFMHRVAEATIKDFVDEACEKLISTLGSPAGAGAAP
ncbi:MAG: hypothetical protein MUP92_00150 [Actinobacteria bacterium]|nr:hypothetical protein [Actinomycetota bacterium]